MKSIICIFCLLALSTANAGRIRLHKVKDAPKSCTVMKEDELLSRNDKLIWATERDSIVIDDEVTLVNDLGQKICSWDKSAFAGFGNIADFRFYIDEYKEVIYPYLGKKDTGILVFKVPFRTCSLEDQKTVVTLDFPKCERPKSKKKTKKKKV